MGLSVGISRNFRDCFWTVRAKFSGLFSDSPDRILRTIFRQSRIVLRFGFDPRTDARTDVFRFCGMFWYRSNSVTNREGTKRCPVLYRSEIWVILFVIVENLNNMLLCVKLMFIYTCLTF